MFELFGHLFLVPWIENRYFLPSTIAVRFAFAGTGSVAFNRDVFVAGQASKLALVEICCPIRSTEQRPPHTEVESTIVTTLELELQTVHRFTTLEKAPKGTRKNQLEKLEAAKAA